LKWKILFYQEYFRVYGLVAYATENIVQFSFDGVPVYQRSGQLENWHKINTTQTA
jgi:hypothetical protein